MNCQRFRNLIPDYISDKLDPITERAWRRHLIDCRRCWEEAVAAHPHLMLLGCAPEVGGEAADQLVASVRMAIRARKLSSSFFRVRMRKLGLAAALAVAFGLSLVIPGVLVASRPSSPPPVVEPLSGVEVAIVHAAPETVVAVVVDPELELP